MPRSIAKDDPIVLAGGYDMEPAWVTGRSSCQVIVSAFLPGQNTLPAAVAKPVGSITAGSVTGHVVVLPCWSGPPVSTG